MTLPQKSATDLAANMAKTAKGATDDYLSARQTLLAEEIELRRHTERVAQMRRDLPKGPRVETGYVFRSVGNSSAATTVKLSELFVNGSDSLVVYCYMFPRHKMDSRESAEHGELAKLPKSQQPCPSCTGPT